MTCIHPFAATLTDRPPGPVAASPAGNGANASRDEFNHGAPWARQWMRDELAKASVAQNTIGLIE